MCAVTTRLAMLITLNQSDSEHTTVECTNLTAQKLPATGTLENSALGTIRAGA
jgi:hypothetical protein